MNQKEIVLTIEGMHCSSCAMNIDFALEDIEGVHEVTTNYVKQISTVIFDTTKTNQKKITTVISELGYKVK